MQDASRETPDRLLSESKRSWRNTFIREGEQNTLQPNLLAHCLITGGTLVLILITFVGLRGFANVKANEWLKAPAIKQEVLVPEQGATQLTPVQTRLQGQLTEIESRIERHTAVMIYFYQQYFISLSLASGLGLIAAFCLFFISRDGWQKANNALINVFMVTSSAALLYNQLPALFKQDINLSANRDLYLQYAALQNKVLSYQATGGTTGINLDRPDEFVDNVKPSLFIHEVDRKLAQLNQIPIEFDAAQIIKIPDFREIDSQTGLPVRPPSPSPKSQVKTEVTP
jgi:hypothetical protein